MKSGRTGTRLNLHGFVFGPELAVELPPLFKAGEEDMKIRAHTPEINSSEHWRLRAEEMRRITEETHDPSVREMMLRLAGGFDRLAEHARARPTRVISEIVVAGT